MNTFDIITVTAVILFARLGVRLYQLQIKYRDEKKDQDEDNNLNYSK